MSFNSWLWQQVFGLTHIKKMICGTSTIPSRKVFLQTTHGSLEAESKLLPIGDLYGLLQDWEVLLLYIGIPRERPERTAIRRVVGPVEFFTNL